jgi:hypothetical protein
MIIVSGVRAVIDKLWKQTDKQRDSPDRLSSCQMVIIKGSGASQKRAVSCSFTSLRVDPSSLSRPELTDSFPT